MRLAGAFDISMTEKKKLEFLLENTMFAIIAEAFSSRRVDRRKRCLY